MRAQIEGRSDFIVRALLATASGNRHPSFAVRRIRSLRHFAERSTDAE
jgi:hypothetical protein